MADEQENDVCLLQLLVNCTVELIAWIDPAIVPGADDTLAL